MKPLRRVLALVTLTAFGVQALAVVNLAHAASPADAPSPPGFIQATQGLAQGVAQIQALLASIQEKAARGEDTSAELRELQGATQTFQALLSQLQGQLDATAQRLQRLAGEGVVSGEVPTRFEAFRANFGNVTAGVLASLAALQAPSATPLGQRVEAVRGALSPLTPAQPLTITHDEVEPRKLPHRRSDTPRRKPKRWPAIPYTEPPGPQDLAPTVDAPLTPEIQALAAQHHLDPAALFAFVHDTIEFQPYFGSLKGAQGTLLEKAGNDMDQASLLIALLRASDIPARYVTGVVDLPIHKVMNWLGVETPQAALRLFAQNGIPVQARMDNEDAEDDDEVDDDDQAITDLRFFHVWVEAFLPRDRDRDADHDRGRHRHRGRHHGREHQDGRAPHHGRRAVPRGAWVPLDPSFKEHEFTEGIDLAAATGFDVNAFLQGVTTGATINEAGSFFTNLNEPFIQQDLARRTDNLLAFVRNELGPEATVGQVLGTKRIEPTESEDLDDLKEVFPFETFTPQLKVAELPQHFRHLVNFAMFGFSKLFPLPELAGKRVTVSYVAATPQDQALIDAFGGILNVFPAFLVDLKPQFKVEGQLIAEGQGVPLGSSQILRSAFRRPLETTFDINDRVVTTGAHYAVSLDLQRVRLNMLRDRAERFLRQLESSGPNPQLTTELIEETLHVTGLAYFAQIDALSDVVASISRVRYTREPSEAILSQDLLVLFLFGIPLIVLKGSVGVDVKRNIINPISAIGDRSQEVQFMLASGSFGSAAEHAVFEQLYEIPAVSTERLLMLANRGGIPIFTISTSNLNQVLPRLETFPIVKQNIIESVNAGFTAIVPQRNQRFHD